MTLVGEREDIQHFTLSGLLQEGHVIAVNKTSRIVTLMAANTMQPLVMQIVCTELEYAILMPLLDSYPYYTSYETLYASFYLGSVTEKAIKKAHERLEEARAENIWDLEIRSLRNMLSRLRLKLRDCGIEINSIVETGYMLLPSALARGQRS